eukprot:467214_1
MGFSRAEQMNYLSISLFSVVLIAIILARLTYKLFCVSDNKGKIKHTRKITIESVKLTAVLQLLSFLLSYATWIIQVFVEDEFIIFSSISVVMYISWAIGWVSIYAFMALRLYYTFKDSMYRMSCFSIIFHCIIIIIIPIWYLGLVLEDHMKGSVELYLIIAAVGFPVIFVGLSTLIYQFNRKLFLLILSQKQSVVTEEDIQPLLTDRQLSTLSTMTKHALLGSITLTFCVMFIVIIPCVGVLNLKQQIVWIIYEWFLSLVVIVNVICVYFGFSINRKEYDICCYKCHWFCRNRCESCAERHLMKNEGSVTTRQKHISLTSTLDSMHT